MNTLVHGGVVGGVVTLLRSAAVIAHEATGGDSVMGAEGDGGGMELDVEENDEAAESIFLGRMEMELHDE